MRPAVQFRKTDIVERWRNFQVEHDLENDAAVAQFLLDRFVELIFSFSFAITNLHVVSSVSFNHETVV